MAAAKGLLGRNDQTINTSSSKGGGSGSSSSRSSSGGRSKAGAAGEGAAIAAMQTNSAEPDVQEEQQIGSSGSPSTDIIFMLAGKQVIARMQKLILHILGWSLGLGNSSSRRCGKSGLKTKSRRVSGRRQQPYEQGVVCGAAALTKESCLIVC